MNRIALALGLLGAAGLLLVSFVGSSDLVPGLLPPAVTAIGGLLAVAGIATSRPRLHGSGVVVAVIGVSLTGVSLATSVIALAVASATLLIASLNLHLVLPEQAGGVTLILAAIVSAAAVAGIALAIGRLTRWLGGGGVDAAGGVAAWLLVVAAVTWGLVRWAREAQPR